MSFPLRRWRIYLGAGSTRDVEAISAEGAVVDVQLPPSMALVTARFDSTPTPGTSTWRLTISEAYGLEQHDWLVHVQEVLPPPEPHLAGNTK